MSLLTACRNTVRRTFRIQSLRPEQESAMLAVVNGRDALVSLPTGFGKSLIYQVPAVIVERPTIVISPLIALMTDQQHALRKCGVPVIAQPGAHIAELCRRESTTASPMSSWKPASGGSPAISTRGA